MSAALFPIVFSYFVCLILFLSCLQVCSRWRDAVYQKSVWRGVEARLHLRRSNPTLFPSLARRGIRRVQVLSLRKSLRDLVTGLPHLTSLNLSGCYNLSDAALDTALNRDLPALRVLNLSLCKDITDNSLGRIATHCPGLEALELGGCTRITNTGLLLISWGLRNIRRLNLRSCWQISDHGIGHLAGQSGGGSSSSSGGGAKSLEELSLQDCQKLTDESLRHISEGLPRLARLNLSFCLSVTDTGLKSLARLASLRDLNLRSCDNVSDIGLGFLSDGSASSGQSPLRRLDVSFCDRVTDSAMTHVASGLTQLVSLSLSACAISDAGVARIAKDLKALEVLNIGQCVRLTDKAIETIGEQMGSLRSVDLYGCTKMSAGGLARLAECRQVEVVNRGLWHQF
jgi:F-box/leucine-rich repeat protein 14